MNNRHLLACGLPDLPIEAFTPCGARMVLCGGGGGSSSSSSSSTTEIVTDKRLAVQEGIGISSDSSTVNVTALDGGVIEGARSIIGQALESTRQQISGALELTQTGAANNLTGYTELLGLTGNVLDRLLDANSENQALVGKTIDASTSLNSAGGISVATKNYLIAGAVVAGALVLTAAVKK